MLLSLLATLPLALAAPTCSLKPSSSATASAPYPSSSSSSSSPSNPSGAGTNGTIVMSWFADWRTQFGVSDINWSHYTHMAFFAGQPSIDGTLEVLVSDPSTVTEFTSAALAHGVKPLLTVGGWDTSIYFSSSVATSSNRTTFVNSIVEYAYANNFAGIDIDWEYPNRQGVGCNTISPEDTANLLSFLTELRTATTNLTLSAAASITPWVDSSGSPSTNLTAFNDVLDWIELMNYDVYGTFSKVTGPNSPLNDTCAPSGDQEGSAVSAVTAWTDAGISPSKLVLGVASYGHSFTVPSSTALTGNNLNIYTSFDSSDVPIGDSWDPPSTSPDVCGNLPTGNGNTGIYHYWALIQDGFLNQDGSVASGMNSLFDNCSQTPFVYDPSNTILVSYDNVQSFTIKGQYVKANGLGGIAMYETGGDYNGTLIQAIATAMQ